MNQMKQMKKSANNLSSFVDEEDNQYSDLNINDLLFMNKIKRINSQKLLIPGEDSNLIFTLLKDANSSIYQKKIGNSSSAYFQTNKCWNFLG